MKSTNIEIDSLDILQELFGINDKLIKVIENRLGVSITQRNSCITVSGTNDGRIHSAVNIIEAMKEALEKQQQLSENTSLCNSICFCLFDFLLRTHLFISSLTGTLSLYLPTSQQLRLLLPLQLTLQDLQFPGFQKE